MRISDWSSDVCSSDLADGEVSAPFRTQAGWHIVKRTGVRQADVGDDNRRAQVRETIGRRKLEDEWNRFLRELRGDAYVDYRNDADQQVTPEAAPPLETPATPPANGGRGSAHPAPPGPGGPGRGRAGGGF